jgi:hypothetical protein
MPRIKLLLNNNDPTSFSKDHMRALFSEYFDIEVYSPGQTYDKHSTVLAVNSFKLGSANPDFWYREFLEQGYKVIVDNLWEIESFLPNHYPDYTGDSFVAQLPNWFWYNEAIWYDYLGYRSYVPNRTYQRRALMPMRVDRSHRREMTIALCGLLDNMIWSFTAHGRSLPDDLPQDHPDYQRYFNPAWYNDTHFSIVVETEVDVPGVFVTEKTFKPMAFQHPFVVMGQAGHLNYLHTQGFETYSNLFDQSYDSIPDWHTRLAAVIRTIKNFTLEPYDKLTQQKITHNHTRFYDLDLVKSCLETELITPIYDYAESR